MQGSKLYVGNLPYAIDESELQDYSLLMEKLSKSP